MPARDEFLTKMQSALDAGTFVKLTLSQPTSHAEPGLRNVYARVVEIKEGPRLSVLYRYERRDVTKNFPFAEAIALLRRILGGEWERAHLFTSTGDWQLRCRESGEGKLKAQRPTFAVAPPPEHDRRKEHVLGESAQAWLLALGVTNADGVPRPGMVDKLRQIHRFVELLGHLLEDSPLSGNTHLRIADMGAGKGYLTFAMAEYFRAKGVEAEVTGVELRPELVEKCNQVARESKFSSLRFETGAIGEWKPTGPLDILVALHACDTATDDALYQGVSSGASLLVTAPCCHKEVRPQLNAPAGMTEILRHGILAEREAEILTDGIRALLLEIRGYSTKVFEFISPEHTSKNLMLAAHRSSKPRDPATLRESLQKVTADYGIRRQTLASLFGETIDATNE